MIGEMTCPDCGGIVGATETTDAGPPCRCFADHASPMSASMSGTLTGTMAGRFGLGTDANVADPLDPSNATASDLLSASPPPPSEPAVVVKVCRACGTDVAGHRRYKDSLGYLCEPCKREEEKRENQGRVRCRVCGKLVKEENLTAYEGTKMCPTCHEERLTVRKTEIKRMGFRGARTRDELRQIYITLAAAGVLVLIILVGALYKHFHH